MRIISGKYRGHQLHRFSADHIRPTTDRVKETLFNILQNNLSGATVLDLFSGTGNLGIEAISRGAKKVIFVESHPQSLAIIRKNLEKLKVTEPYEIYAKDVLSFLKMPPVSAVDIVFADPPFTKEMADEVMSVASQSEIFGIETVMAIESAKKERLQTLYGEITQIDQRIFGDKILSFFKKIEPHKA